MKRKKDQGNKKRGSERKKGFHTSKSDASLLLAEKRSAGCKTQSSKVPSGKIENASSSQKEDKKERMR